MKKITNILFVAATLMAATLACSQDDNVGRTFGNKNITIDSSAVNFTDAPSTGKVTVTAASPISKTTVSNDWCKCSFSGNVVTVEVGQNTSLTSRVANLTIWAGTDSVVVPVHQQGLSAFTIEENTKYTLNNNDTTITLTYRHIEGVNVRAITPNSWIRATVEKGKVNLTITANTANAVREGYVDISSGKRQPVRISIQQNWNVDELMNGEWEITYFTKRDSTGLTRKTFPCTFDKDSIRIHSNQYGDVAIPFRLQKSIPATFHLDGTVRCGGILNGHSTLLVFISDEGNSSSALSTGSTMSGKILPNAAGKLSIRPTGFIFGNKDQTISRISLMSFDNLPPTGLPKNNSGFKEVFATFFYPTFIKK